jgi:hypothetical protein
MPPKPVEISDPCADLSLDGFHLLESLGTVLQEIEIVNLSCGCLLIVEKHLLPNHLFLVGLHEQHDSLVDDLDELCEHSLGDGAPIDHFLPMSCDCPEKTCMFRFLRLSLAEFRRMGNFLNEELVLRVNLFDFFLCTSLHSDILGIAANGLGGRTFGSSCGRVHIFFSLALH